MFGLGCSVRPIFKKGIGVGGLLVSAMLLMSACSKSANPAAPPPVPTNAAAFKTRPLSTNLWDEVLLVEQLPFEYRMDRRPAVISERGSDRQHWAQRLLEQGYRATARTNAAWDAAVLGAFDGLSLYSRGNDSRGVAVMSNAVVAALAAGCTDPMIRYLQTRYSFGAPYPDWTTYAIAMTRHTAELSRSAYHPVFKFTVAARAMDAVKNADRRQNRGPLIAFAQAYLVDTARDTNAPAIEIFQGLRLMLDDNKTKGYVDMILTDLEGILEKYWGREEEYFRTRGEVEERRAWESRGGGYINTVTAEGQAGFENHLRQAENFLNEAWRMNPSNAYTAFLMMRVELGQGQGRPRMERWFNRAMDLATNYFDAAQLMSFYLEPRWYGSEQEALRFARSCVVSTHWGGRVPLVLPSLHQSLAIYQKQAESAEYWHRPQVWTDVQSAYEKFFRLNPEAVEERHWYARDAFRCGKYPVFLEQARHFTEGTNADFFGGQAKWEQMLQTASTQSETGG